MELALELASRWRRLGGALIDSLISLVIIIPIMFVFGIFEQVMQGQGMTINQQALILLLSLVIFLVVNAYLLANYGQTVGKRLVGTRIVSNMGGQNVSLLKIFGLRVLPISLIAQIPFAGAILILVDTLFIFREDKRCIHDLIAATKVVKI